MAHLNNTQDTTVGPIYSSSPPLSRFSAHTRVLSAYPPAHDLAVVHPLALDAHVLAEEAVEEVAVAVHRNHALLPVIPTCPHVLSLRPL